MPNTKLPSLNKVLIVGNLVKDPELSYTSAGVPVVNFKIASHKKFKDNLGIYREEVSHIGVVAWQELAESCDQFLKKGSAVLVEGELRSRLREKQNGIKRNLVEIKALHVQFLDKRTDSVSLTEEQSILNLSQGNNLTEIESSW
jgi:single-strand DNA-binding protein